MKLPFTDLIATVKPIKPKPLTSKPSPNTTPSPAAPKVPSSDAVLAYFKSQFKETETSEIKCEFSSPLVLTSTSRTASVPKIEGLNILEESKASNCLNDFKLPVVPPATEAAKFNTKRESTLTSEMLFPYLSPSLKLGSTFMPVFTKPTQQMYPHVFYDDYTYPCVSGAAVSSLASPLLYPDISGMSQNAMMSIPSIGSLPIVSLDPSRRATDNYFAMPNYNRFGGCYSPALSPYNNVPYGSMSSLNPLYSMPYPLRYNVLSLPTVVTPSNIMPPGFYTDGIFQNPYASPLFIENPYMSRISPKGTSNSVNVPKSSCHYPQCKTVGESSISASPPLIPSTTSNHKNAMSNTRSSLCSNNPSLSQDFSFPDTLSFDYESPSLEFDPSFFNGYRNVDCSNDLTVPDFMTSVNAILKKIDRDICNDITNFQANIDVYPSIPEFHESIPSFTPIQEIPTDVPQLCLTPLESDDFGLNMAHSIPTVSQVNNVLDVSQTSSIVCTSRPSQSSKMPSTYINVSPTYTLSQSTPNAVASINNVVSEMTQNILSAFMSYLPLLIKKQPIRPTNPYIAPQCKSRPIYPSTKFYPSTTLVTNIPTVPILPQVTNTPIMSSLDNFGSSAPTKILLESFSNSLYTDGTTISMPTASSGVANAAFADDFPSASFISYSPVVEIVPITETPPLAPVQLTMLPPASFSDYFAPRPCPADLPSPIIPAYFEIEPVRKYNGLGKNTKTIEKLLELVFLTELLNGESYVDWDALETVLAVLCVDN